MGLPGLPLLGSDRTRRAHHSGAELRSTCSAVPVLELLVPRSATRRRCARTRKPKATPSGCQDRPERASKRPKSIKNPYKMIPSWPKTNCKSTPNRSQDPSRHTPRAGSMGADDFRPICDSLARGPTPVPCGNCQYNLKVASSQSESTRSTRKSAEKAKHQSQIAPESLLEHPPGLLHRVSCGLRR